MFLHYLALHKSWNVTLTRWSIDARNRIPQGIIAVANTDACMCKGRDTQLAFLEPLTHQSCSFQSQVVCGCGCCVGRQWVVPEWSLLSFSHDRLELTLKRVRLAAASLCQWWSRAVWRHSLVWWLATSCWMYEEYLFVSSLMTTTRCVCICCMWSTVDCTDIRLTKRCQRK